MGNLESSSSDKAALTRNDFVDFSDTEIAFSHKSDRELKKALWIFSLMHKSWLVDFFSPIAQFMTRWHIPPSKALVKATIFDQFVGGETLQESQEAIEKLWRRRTLSVLDYGAEGKSSEADLDKALEQFMAAVTFAASNESVPVVSVKVSALAENEVLEAIHAGNANARKQEKFERVKERVHSLCRHAYDLGVKVFIDAEESWMQAPIDDMANEMMRQYNRESVTVYNTFQLYLKDRYDYLVSSFAMAEAEQFMLGAKLVRGAYLEKERERARELGYPSPVHETKDATDRDFNRAIAFCIEHYEKIASCCATHNMESCLYQAELIGKRNLPRNHHHLNFCQLYGMSDHITFNLAASGYNVAKYVVFGKVEEVVPYLSRRAEENSAVAGEFGREYKLLLEEAHRRGLR